jgi:hypothetical protein
MRARVPKIGVAAPTSSLEALLDADLGHPRDGTVREGRRHAGEGPPPRVTRSGLSHSELAATGIVPAAGGKGRRGGKQPAGRLFLTRGDLPPLLVLMAALTGCGGEMVKELPAAHRLLDDKAVEVSVIKRRRGPAH